MHKASQVNKIITAVIMVVETFLRFTENIKQGTTVRIWNTQQLDESQQRAALFKSVLSEFLLQYFRCQ